MRPKIRGSQSAFMRGRLVFTKYDSGCLRSILLKSHGIRDEIDASHGIRGAFHEDRYEETLRQGGTDYIKEKVIKGPLPTDPGADFSGRADFITSDCVHELKSTQSKNRYYSIKKGEIPLNYLAQTVAYMCQEKTPNGVIVQAYYEPVEVPPPAYTCKFEIAQKISIDKNGEILVDSVSTEYSVHELYRHQHFAAKVQRDGIVWDRPYGYEEKFSSPCAYCPFKETCDQWDNGALRDVTAFIKDAQQRRSE